MKKNLYILLLFWSGILFAQTKGFTPKNTTVPEGTERRFALVIGNKDYIDISPLQNPINDANDVSAALQKIGFEVVTLTNADQRKMGTTFRDFLQKLLPSDVALVYYSGHGISYNGKNYLIPTDATIKCLQDVEDYKTLESMVVSLESRGVRNTFIFLDACRNLPNLKPCMSETKDVVISKGLIRPSHNPRGSMIVFATGEGETADDNSKDRNGLFTGELLKHLTTPNIGLRQIIDRTKRGVETRSNERQSPARYDALSDEFVFVITEDSPKNTNEFSQKQLEEIEKERLENEALKKEIARLKEEKGKVVTTQPKNSESSNVYRDVVEESPEFNGGQTAMSNYISEHLKYPSNAQKANIQGKVFVQFMVNKTGKIGEIEVLKGIGFGCDEEATNMISKMPIWNPGKKNGEPVNCLITLPIVFKLEEEKSTEQSSTKEVLNNTSSITLTGKVIDASDGSDLPGTSIQIKGTPRGTSTDIKGNFKLENLSKSVKIIFKYVGYRTIEFEIKDGENKDVIIKMNPK